jgi:uncharacterized membrane protein YGL010W
MNSYFRQQLAVYARYHRDGRNCVLHCLGIPAIFLGVMIVLAFYQVTIGGYAVSIGSILVTFAAMVWIALDVGIGTAMLVVIAPLTFGAEWIARLDSVLGASAIAAALFVVGWAFQIMGHTVFERRKPAFLDDLSQMFIGPMFVMGKLLVALRLRPDLAAPLCGAGEITANARQS